jgi:hypothetical protein
MAAKTKDIFNQAATMQETELVFFKNSFIYRIGHLLMIINCHISLVH